MAQGKGHKMTTQDQRDIEAFEKRWREVEGEYECEEHFWEHKIETKETFLAGINYERTRKQEGVVKSFEEWFDSTGYYHGPGLELHKNTQKSVWLARQPEIEAKDEEINRLKDQNARLLKDGKEELSRKDKRIAFLEAECTRLYDPTRKFWNESLETQIDAKDAIIEKLKEALEYYADTEIYNRPDRDS